MGVPRSEILGEMQTMWVILTGFHRAREVSGSWLKAIHVTSGKNWAMLCLSRKFQCGTIKGNRSIYLWKIFKNGMAEPEQQGIYYEIYFLEISEVMSMKVSPI